MPDIFVGCGGICARRFNQNLHSSRVILQLVGDIKNRVWLVKSFVDGKRPTLSVDDNPCVLLGIVRRDVFQRILGQLDPGLPLRLGFFAFNEGRGDSLWVVDTTPTITPLSGTIRHASTRTASTRSKSKTATRPRISLSRPACAYTSASILPYRRSRSSCPSYSSGISSAARTTGPSSMTRCSS